MHRGRAKRIDRARLGLRAHVANTIPDHHHLGAIMTITNIDQRRTDREKRDARDRVLAREVGIEIGRRRESARAERRAARAWERGFIIGFLLAAFIVAAWFVGAERAYGNDAVGKRWQSSGASERYPLPKHWRVYVRIAQCEQPAIASRPAVAARKYWKGVRWDHPGMGNGRGWPGGLGMLHVHWEQFKPRGAPRLQQHATPAQQLISADRAYRYFRRIYGAVGGTTFWVCSKQLGWRGIVNGRPVWSR